MVKLKSVPTSQTTKNVYQTDCELDNTLAYVNELVPPPHDGLDLSQSGLQRAGEMPRVSPFFQFSHL